MIKNYQILKEQINYAIQNSGLDIGATYFILKDIFSDIEKMYYGQINKELLNESGKQDEFNEINNDTNKETD